MSFDGDYQTEENKWFDDTIESIWKISNELGSRWYFYPFHFVCTDKTIVDAPEQLEFLKGKRIKTAQRLFKTVSEKPENEGCEAEEYIFKLEDHYYECLTLIN